MTETTASAKKQVPMTRPNVLAPEAGDSFHLRGFRERALIVPLLEPAHIEYVCVE